MKVNKTLIELSTDIKIKYNIFSDFLNKFFSEVMSVI